MLLPNKIQEINSRFCAEFTKSEKQFPGPESEAATTGRLLGSAGGARP